jgi:Sulfotransferase family
MYRFLSEPEEALSNSIDAVWKDGAGVNSPAELFHKIGRGLISDPIDTILLEKTPSNVYHIEELLEKFSNSKILILTRDLRAILASKKNRNTSVNEMRYDSDQLQSKKLEKDFNVLADSMAWKKAIQNGIAGVKKYPDRVLGIKYEDLVKNHKEELIKIFEFLGMEFSFSSPETSFSSPGNFRKRNLKGIYTDSINEWKKALTNEEIRFGEFLGKREMRICGYAPVFNKKFTLAILQMIPGQAWGFINRIVKRFRFFSYWDLIIYSKNWLKR